MQDAKLHDYVDSLDLEQLRFVCYHTIRQQLQAEVVVFSEEYDYLYWDATGDRLEENE